MEIRNDVIVEVNNISHTFLLARNNPIRAINCISLSVPRGQFISFIGPTGCGKTTLLKIIGGLISPMAGQVFIAKQSPQYAQMQGRIGFVFQEPMLLPWRNVIRNISLPQEILPIKKKFREPEELLRSVGLEGFGNNLPKELSGGMKSRVAIARVLSYEPDVLFMDEPFANLDEVTRDLLNLELLNIWKRACLTILYVTHSITEAVFLSDRIVVMSPQPAKIIQDVKVNFGRPRGFHIKKTPDFVYQVEALKELLYHT